MSLKPLPYRTLKSLFGQRISKKEDPETQLIIDSLANAKKRGWLTKPELIKICKWKSPRGIRHIKQNREVIIKKITKEALSTRSEQRKLKLLTSLKGVSVPMASAILMLTNPKRYGVIDIRVWQLLYKMGTVNTNADGAGFNFKHWYRFLKIIRYFAKKYKVGVRDIERTLFKVHVKFQKGRLYKN
jgi:hypothetical protein